MVVGKSSHPSLAVGFRFCLWNRLWGSPTHAPGAKMQHHRRREHCTLFRFRVVLFILLLGGSLVSLRLVARTAEVLPLAPAGDPLPLFAAATAGGPLRRPAAPAPVDDWFRPVKIFRPRPPPAAPPPPPPPPPAPAAAAAAGEEEDSRATSAGEHPGERAVVDPFAASPHGGPGASAAADLDAHRANEECWRHFDLGFLEAWDATAAVMCAPRAAGDVGPHALGPPFVTAGGGGGGAPAPAPAPAAAGARPPPPPAPAALAAAVAGGSGWLRCRVTVDSHLPGPTAPHTLCDGANVLLRPALLAPTGCLPSRGGYKCEGAPVHWLFPRGALGAACAPTAALAPAAFPNDHLKDMFSGWEGFEEGGGGGGVEDAPGEVVLVVARERGEHANLFHATTDWLNAFIALSVAGVVDPVTGGRENMGGVQVLLLDEQRGPFEELFYKRVLSPAHPVLTGGGLRGAGAAAPALRLRRALFVPPGYTNMLLSHVASEGDCHARTALLQGFRAFVLGGVGLLAAAGAPPPAGAPLRVTLVTRRPYAAAGVEHPFMGRQLDNEAELAGALAAALAAALGPAGAPAELAVADLATLSAEAQVALMATRTDVLVGMHGAALTYAALLPPWAGVVELWPKDRDMWRCFEHLAAMAGLAYERWENADPAALRVDAAGDYTRVDAPAVAALVARVGAGALERRNKGG
jgi:hypothetical protein